MSWASLALSIVKIVAAFLDALERNKLITMSEKAQAYDILKGVDKDVADAQEARRDQQRRNSDPSGLRDDDGHRRD